MPPSPKHLITWQLAFQQKIVPANLSNLTESAVGVFSAIRPLGSTWRIISQRELKMTSSVSLQWCLVNQHCKDFQAVTFRSEIEPLL